MLLYLLNISLPFILFRFLCLGCAVFGVGWKFVVPLYCGTCSLWRGLDQWLVKFFWSGELVSMFWRVELDLFPLECNEVTSSDFWGVYGFGKALGILSFNSQVCVPALLKN